MLVHSWPKAWASEYPCRKEPSTLCLLVQHRTDLPPEIYLPTSHPTSILISPPGNGRCLGNTHSLQVVSLCPQVGTKQSLPSGVADSDYLFGPFLKLKRISVFLLSLNGMKAQTFRVGRGSQTCVSVMDTISAGSRHTWLVSMPLPPGLPAHQP